MFARIQETVIRKSFGRYALTKTTTGQRTRLAIYDHSNGRYYPVANYAEVESYLTEG